MVKKVKNHIRKIRYLHHPYLITRAILRPFGEWESQKHRLRGGEYKGYSVSLEEGAEILTGIKKSDIVKLMRELEGPNFLQHINLSIKQIEDIGDSMGVESGLLLYVLMRASHPEIVVETGVANGISSSFILKALDQNARGRLYSIDLHYREGVSVPLGKHLGWVIPEELRQRWNLILGESTKALPKLLSKLGSIDVFLHDSRHTYKTMMKEYSIVWPHLKDGGLLLSDDVICNDAFLDFADRIKQKPIIFARMGSIVKNSKYKKQLTVIEK